MGKDEQTETQPLETVEPIGKRVLVSDVKVIPMRTSWQLVFFVESSNKPDSSDGK